MIFDAPCIRCGICCMITPCKLAIEAAKDLQLEQSAPGCCRWLRRTKDTATTTCGLAQDIRNTPGADWIRIAYLFGFDRGCCIESRAIVNGKTEDIAHMEHETKRALAARLWEGIHDGQERQIDY